MSGAGDSGIVVLESEICKTRAVVFGLGITDTDRRHGFSHSVNYTFHDWVELEEARK